MTNIWQNKLFLFFTLHGGFKYWPKCDKRGRSANNLYELHRLICCLLTNVPATPVKIFDFDSDKMTWIWNRSSKEGWVSSGNMGGRTGQSLLKSFSITEEREAIVL